MPKLSVFNNVTLDGYFTGPNGDLSWAHARSADPEWRAFVADNAKGGGTMLFGRITWEMMKSYWPTPEAMKDMPVVAERMNKGAKVVFSRSLDKADWSNTRVVKGDIAAEIRRLKKEPGADMVMMGSGSIIAQLAPEGVIDEYQFVVHPVIIGKGRTMFDGVKEMLSFTPTKTRSFKNGAVLLVYQPA